MSVWTTVNTNTRSTITLLQTGCQHYVYSTVVIEHS